jgi:long-subunit fatty acid transport protein
MKELSMNDKHNRIVYAILLSAVAGLVTQNAGAAGFYLAEVGTPTSLGTGGVANPTNTYGADAAWTNPAGMTGLERDSMVAGLQVVAPKMEFDPSTASGGGDDGGKRRKARRDSQFLLCQDTDRRRPIRHLPGCTPGGWCGLRG